MSILNITNLTDNPRQWIYDRFNAYRDEVETDLGITINEDELNDFIEGEIDLLIETMEEAQGRDLLGIIDNYLVNQDYYAILKEYFENK